MTVITIEKANSTQHFKEILIKIKILTFQYLYIYNLLIYVKGNENQSTRNETFYNYKKRNWNHVRMPQIRFDYCLWIASECEKLFNY